MGLLTRNELLFVGKRGLPIIRVCLSIIYVCFLVSGFKQVVAQEQTTAQFFESNNDAIKAGEQLLDLPLTELMKIKVFQPATLTKTSLRNIPAAVTRITASQIERSMARSLNELLEIYVPGLQWINHRFGFSHLGARSIMSDRDEKYLLLVNGRSINEKTLVGAVTERDLVLLGDIHHIDIIRGPGSATYGVGAVAMVINVITYDSKTFNGTQARTQVGIGEDYVSQELKLGHDFSNARSLFFYAGITDYQGADSDDAPLHLSASGTDRLGRPVTAEEDLTFNVGPDKGQYRDRPKVKLHVQTAKDDWELWFRYTRGGEVKPMGPANILQPPIGGGSVFFDGDLYPTNQLGYQQFTFLSQWQVQPNNPDWSLKHSLSFDTVDYERMLTGNSDVPLVIQSFREDKYRWHGIANWEPGGAHALAVGMEINHEKFNLDSPGFPNEPAAIPGFDDGEGEWSTNTLSIFFEHQWLFNEELISFLSARVDDHTYTSPLLSPRWSLVHTPNNVDTYKLILARSQRMNFAVDMREEFLISGNSSTEPETLDSIEIRYSKQTSAWRNSISLYYEMLDLIGFPAGGADNQRVVAEESIWGLEWELAWQNDRWLISGSHSYTHLLEFKLREGITRSFVSAKPNGFGDELNNWSNHLTKLVAEYKIDDRWAINSSLIYYWGFDGILDYQNLRAAVRLEEGEVPRYQSGNEAFIGANAYLNLGATFNPSHDLTIHLNGHNLLGLLDESYNKRNYFLAEGEYRLQAASVSLAVDYQF